MDGYQAPSAGSHYRFDNMLESDMDIAMSQYTYGDDNHMQNAQHQSTMYDESPTSE